MTTHDFASLCQGLTESLAERGEFREDWLRPLFERVPRHAFAPDVVWEWSGDRWWPVRRSVDEQRWAELVYHPTDALVTQVDDGECSADGSGLVPTSSISCAGAVLDMLASLAPEHGHAVLEIGTGSGYNAALLCERVGESNVVSVEVDKVLTAQARDRLKAAGYAPEVICADGEEGCPNRAPYDRLISTASVRRVPFAWLEQMQPDGEIVTPWLPNERALGLIWLRMRGPGVARGWFHGAETFMPVRGQRRERADLAALWHATHESAEESHELYDLTDVDVHGEFALGVLLPGVTCYRQGEGWFFMAEDRQSWSRIDGGTVHRRGDRDLLREVCDALQWWRERDRPKLFDFGVTVTAEEQTVWLLEPQNPVRPL